MMIEPLSIIALVAISMLILPIQFVTTSMFMGLLYGTGSGGLMLALWVQIAHQSASPNTISQYATFTAAAKVGQAMAIIAIGAILQWLDHASLWHWKDMIGEIMAGILIGGILALLVVAAARNSLTDTLGHR